MLNIINMDLKLGTIEQDILQKGKGAYYLNDYTIEYNLDDFIVIRENLLIYDTLTVSFDLFSRKFISVDAFSNKDIWFEKDKIEIPKFKNGTLKNIEGFEHTDRYSFKYVPFFEYSKEGVLKIILADDCDSSSFFQIAENLIVGIKYQRITMFFFVKVKFYR